MRNVICCISFIIVSFMAFHIKLISISKCEIYNYKILFSGAQLVVHMVFKCTPIS